MLLALPVMAQGIAPFTLAEEQEFQTFMALQTEYKPMTKAETWRFKELWNQAYALGLVEVAPQHAPAQPLDGGATCAAAPTVSLSYDQVYIDSGTTCGKGHNYDDNPCDTSYDNGEDAIYILNITAPGDYAIDFSNTAVWAGFLVTDDCPNEPTAVCVDNVGGGSGGNPSGVVNFATPGTYYLQIDTWPSPDCTAYDLQITAPESPRPDFSGSIKTAMEDYDNWLITYTIGIENSGNLDAVNVYLTDTIPANTGYVASSAVASSGTITEGVGILEWTGTVLSQTTEVFTFTVDILGAPLYDTVITNTASISHPLAAVVAEPQAVVTTPLFAPDLSYSMKMTPPDDSHGAQRAVVGTQFPYTITVINSGLDNAPNTRVTDTFPTGSAVYVANSAWSDSGNLIVAGDMLTWTGSIASDDSEQIGYMMAAISLGLSIDNTAWITGDGTLRDVAASTIGIQNPNAYCESVLPLNPTGDMVTGTIGTYDNDDGFWGSGDDIWFTVTPTGTGVLTLTTGTANDLAIGTTAGGCAGTFTTLDSVYGPGQVVVNVNYNQLYYIMVDDIGAYTITLEADYLPFAPRFSGWKQGPVAVKSGDPVTYIVHAENTGELPATGAFIEDTFPIGTTGPATGVVVDGPGSLTGNDAGTLRWEGTLAVGEGVTLSFDLATPANCAAPVLTNTAVISAPAASMAVVVESPPVDLVSEFYFGEGFEGVFPPLGWTNEVITAVDTPTWTQSVASVHPPGYSPHGGNYMVRFNAYNVSAGGSARLASYSVDFSLATAPEVSFWMFHDNAYSTADRIQIQVSTDGGTIFENVGAAILRHDNSGNFWALHAVDLAAYAGESDVIIGFLAISGYGNDIYIDDIILGAPCPCLQTTPHTITPDGDLGEWCPNTELLQTDARPDPDQNLYLTWDAVNVYVAWEGADWDADGDLWLYFYTVGGATGLSTSVNGAHTFPMGSGSGADYAFVYTSTAGSGLFYDGTGGAWVAAPFNGTSAFVGNVFEIAVPRSDLGLGATDGMAMMAFAEDEGNDASWASFPTSNPIGTAFVEIIQWTTTGDGVMSNDFTGSNGPTASEMLSLSGQAFAFPLGVISLLALFGLTLNSRRKK